jgi:Domain of unknown function (DUF4082)
MRRSVHQLTWGIRGRATKVVVVAGALAVVGVGVPVGIMAGASATTAAPSEHLFNPQPSSGTVSTDAKSVELGVHFTPTVSGQIVGVEFLKSTRNVGTHTGSLWTASGTLLATATFTAETASGWQSVLFASPINVTAGTSYTAGYHAPVGSYDSTTGYFAAAHTSGDLGTPVNAGRKSYADPSVAPTTDTGNNSNYWVDVIFTSSVVAPSPAAISSPTDTPSATTTPAQSPTPTVSASPSPTVPASPSPTVSASPSRSATDSIPAPTTPAQSPSTTPSGTSGTNFNFVAHSVGLQANIATKPTVWPNASNTGVPAGTTMKASGALVVTTAGTVLSGLNINGCVDIQANNVTIKNSLITCSRTSVAIRVAKGFGGFLLQDSEVNGGGKAAGCIGFGDFTLLRDNLHDCIDGVDGGGNAVVEYNYVHDLTRLSGTHNDTFQTVGGGHNLLVGNTLQAYRNSTNDLMNSSIQTGHLSSNLTDTLVEYNYMDGGNYTVNAGATSTNGFTIAGYVFVGNQFGHDSRYGPVAELGNGISFDSSNVWAGTTTAVH